MEMLLNHRLICSKLKSNNNSNNKTNKSKDNKYYWIQSSNNKIDKNKIKNHNSNKFIMKIHKLCMYKVKINL